MLNTSKSFEPATTPPAKKSTSAFRSTIIPESFQLGGLTINVRLDDTFIETHGCIGQALYSEQQITIDPSATPQQTTEQAFLHELVHWIFYVMGEHDLRNNERIVDLFAHFLYQALTTAEPLPSPDSDELPFD